MTLHYTVAGVQDGSFEAFRRGRSRDVQYTALCCATLEGDRILDVTVDRIIVDGLDSTTVILNNINTHETDAVILGGVTFGGFNVVDVNRFNRTTGIPTIVYSGDYPDIDATRKALRRHFSDWKLRWSRYEELGGIHKLKLANFPPLYFEKVGCSKEFAVEVLKEQIITCRIPEAVRVADIIAKGVSSIFQDL